MDWALYHDTCLAVFSGINPFSVINGPNQFLNPPWTLVPLLPLCLLPSRAGYFVNGAVSFTTLVAICRRMGLTWLETICMVISPMHLESVVQGNIEWLPLAGVLCPAPIALLLFLTKPQSAISLALLLLVNQWRTTHWKGVAVTVAPTLALTILTLWLWGLPQAAPLTGPRLSLFPYSLLVGLPVLYLGIRRNDLRLTAFTSPFLAPYTTFHGYLPITFPLKGKWMALVIGFFYLYGIVVVAHLLR